MAAFLLVPLAVWHAPWPVRWNRDGLRRRLKHAEFLRSPTIFRPSSGHLMRLLAFAAPCLAALLVAGTAALAEPASGWVDPPAKPDAGKSSSAIAKPVDAAEAKSAEPALRFDTTVRRVSHNRRLTGRRERRQEHRRMAVSSDIDTTAPDPRFGGRAGKARRLTDAYLDSVSSPNAAMLASAPRFYGERVRFHGRTMTVAALIAEKRRFVRRWPERRYAAKDGTMRTACETAGATCIVRTIVGFSADNPARGARSQGLSELTLTVSFAGERPVIVSETSRVLRRGSAALSSTGRGRGDGA